MKRKNYLFISLLLVGAILFGVVSFVLVRSTRTVNAVVPSQEIRAGERIDASMLSVIQVPVNTPTGYITDISSMVGQKLKINAQPGQFLYMTDVMISWDDVVYGVSVPDDYIVTAISMPNERAVGGLITAGDTVDILGVQRTTGSSAGTSTGDSLYRMKDALGPVAEHSYGADGLQVYWILANVKILETDSSLSSEDNNMLAAITEDDSNSGDAYYIVALSYADYQKLVLSQKYLELWMNLAPVWNNENPPLLDLMTYSEIQGLMDAQGQSIVKEITGDDGQVVRSLDEEKLKKLEEAKKKWMEENGYRWEQPQTSPSTSSNPELDTQEQNEENNPQESPPVTSSP
jgi:Flp pilus assembly protein CpaB